MAEFDALRLVWLEAFVQVADTKKRMAVAKEMKISPGTVTKHIRNLEQWLGGRMLLWHDSVPARLTEYGKTVLPVAQEVLDRLRQVHAMPPVLDEAPPAPRISAKNIRVPSTDRTPKDG